MIYFAKTIMYFPLILSAVFTAHAFYGVPFYLIAFLNARRYVSFLSALDKFGASAEEDIADALGIKKEFVPILFERLRKKGYIGK